MNSFKVIHNLEKRLIQEIKEHTETVRQLKESYHKQAELKSDYDALFDEYTLVCEKYEAALNHLNSLKTICLN